MNEKPTKHFIEVGVFIPVEMFAGLVRIADQRDIPVEDLIVEMLSAPAPSDAVTGPPTVTDQIPLMSTPPPPAMSEAEYRKERERLIGTCDCKLRSQIVPNSLLWGIPCQSSNAKCNPVHEQIAALDSRYRSQKPVCVGCGATLTGPGHDCERERLIKEMDKPAEDAGEVLQNECTKSYIAGIKQGRELERERLKANVDKAATDMGINNSAGQYSVGQLRGFVRDFANRLLEVTP